MRATKWVWIGCLALAPCGSALALEGLGLTPNADNLPWARWQGRISMGATAPVWRAGLGGFETSGLKLGSVSLMGDYYFTRALTGPGSSGGFRATSGLIIGPTSQLWASQPGAGAGSSFTMDRHLFSPAAVTLGGESAVDNATQPYVGIGYTGISARGGWSFSADLGLLAIGPASTIRLGRGMSNPQGIDDLMREMRMAPVLQLGVSYSF